tara:strand:+ start:1720 stop:3930 length:2211 start_codon:yes stop_codon:yes gene_type:complete
MKTYIYILLATILIQSCSLFPDKNVAVDLEAGSDLNIVDIIDSLSIEILNSSIIDSTKNILLDSIVEDNIPFNNPIFSKDIFNTIPMQTITYGDTLKLDFSDYIYSNFIDIKIVDLKNFHSELAYNTLFLSPIVNKNQLSSIKLEINNNILDVIIFSVSSNYDDSLYKKNRNATILKDNAESFEDYLLLNYKYLSSGSYDNNLKDNRTYILFGNKILDSRFYHIFGDGIRIMLPKSFQESMLRIISMDNFGVLLNQNNTLFFNNNILSPDQNIISPYFSNMYYVLIDRFFNVKNDSSILNHIDPSIDRKVNFHGGDFSGLSKKINNGYFNRLGINNIILSPITTNPKGYYRSEIAPYRKHMGFDGFWPIRSNSIDQRFGSSEDFKHLIKNSHQHGLGIYLSYILDYTHLEHEYYSKHQNWFSGNNIDGKSFLFELDFSNQSVVQQISKDIVSWINRYNFDGFHYIYSKKPNKNFWKYLNGLFHTETVIENKVSIIHQDGFNFDLYKIGTDHFSSLTPNFKKLNDSLKKNIKENGSINLLKTVTTLNDEPKFISIADGHFDSLDVGDHQIFVDYPTNVINKSNYDKLFMFNLMNNSMPGIPTLFHGDEYGEIGVGHSDSKRNIRFQKKLNPIELKYKSKISKLNNIRTRYPSLSLGDFYVLKEGPGYTVWLKSYFNEHTIIFFNLQDKTTTLNFSIPFESKKMISLLDDQIIELKNSMMASIVVPPMQSGILLLDKK